jgi:DNA-binding beta-propeller fold protein YncE
MLETFACPSCGGPLEYNGGHDKTIRCPFCSNSVIVPKELRAKTAELTPPPAAPQATPFWPILIGAAVILAGVLVVLLALASKRAPLAKPPAPSLPQPVPSAPRTPAPAPGFAGVVMTFGSEGIGPGMFTDARSIAVDAAGRIYVGEYTSGRIQVFDAEGKFITQWMADTRMPLRGMAADRKGTVYVAQRGVISRYDGATGKPTGQLDYPAGRGFDDVAATADGGLVAAWEPYGSGISFGSGGDHIVRFDANGRTVRTIRNAVSAQTESGELELRVAADGLGNIFALSAFSNAVFRFTLEGKFVNRFGSSGRQPGQFTAPGAIAVDGKGRVYVGDFKGIQVFDASGTYIDLIKIDGNPSGITFNDRNEMFVVARSRVIKLVINRQ